MPVAQIISREPHSMLSHAIQGPWGKNGGGTLKFEDRNPQIFEELMHYIHHGFIRRSVSFGQVSRLD